MNKFKITPKIALIIVLVLITVAGIVVYLSYNKKAKNNPTVADSGFLSFFGGRKVKPNDESTIPGVIPNQDGNTGGLSSGLTAGGDTSGDTAGGNTAGANTAGRLTLRPIGGGNLNINDNNGSTTVSGGSGTATAGNTAGNTAGGTSTAGGTGGGSGTTGGNTIPQIDCTPPTLPYTQPQIEELKSLTQRFYRISANLHTAGDIENELDTQKSYFDLYNQAKSYTKQCYAELEQTDPGEKNAGKAVNASARNHPYITEKVLEVIGKYDPRVVLVRNNDATRIDKEITILQDRIAIANSQLYFLNNLKNSGTALNDNQKDKLKILEGYAAVVDSNGTPAVDKDGKPILVKGEIDRLKEEIEYKKNQKWAVQNTKLSLMYGEVLGAFFTEEIYKSSAQNYKFTSTDSNELVLKVPRVNINTRFNKLWNYTAKIIEERGQQTQVIKDMWTVEHEYYQYNPLKPVAQDRVNDSLDTAPRDADGNRNSWVHRFNMLEEGLRIW